MVRAAERTYDARALESRIAAYWEKSDAYAHVKRHRAHAKPYYFLDGPPYATGHIHIGTARNKVLKDVFVRHMRQKGWNVRDQPGYDMHGLPIEVKVEKELGIRSKKDIEEHGIDRFVEACRTFAVDHLRMMNDEFRELAVWLDWDKPYMTITNDYIEGAWWAVEKAHERGLLFESERVLTWCWRCETALANAEVEHEEREDPSCYVKFPVEARSGGEGEDAPGRVRGREGDFLVIWTTTPWTLPANVAIAANPDASYARVRCRKEGREETLIVAASQAESLARIGRYESFEVLGTFPGREMEGLRYVHPFRGEVPYHAEPASEWNNRVILGEHVATDRSGLVHTATGHGVEDFEVGRKYGIPVFSPLGEDGRYTHEAGSFAGLAVKSESGSASDASSPRPLGKENLSDADEAVLAKLRERGLLLASRMEKHAYGHCWRCKNPLVFRATKQWFIDVPKVKDRMVEEVKRVEWTPEWAGSARQLDWVQNARDWCISRQRYWGIPLPVWKCQHCNATTVVGSRRELHHVSDYKQGDDLHRPWIDRVRVACPTRGCGGIMKRVPDVLDVWFDSAVAAWASLAYPGHKKDFDHLFPARWICEGLDQTRGWFYSQLAAGVAAMDRVPYEKVVMHGWVNDAQGRPMSKSLGNIVKPGDVVKKFGCDAFRLGIIGGAAPWDDVSFGEESVRAPARTLNILWNVHVFATQYMHADGYAAAHPSSPHAGRADADAYRHDRDRLARVARSEDKWLLSRLQSTIADATRFIEANEFHRAARTIEQFVLEDLSRWYVRLVRDRVWDEAASDDKADAYAVLYEALHASARLLAPFAPHVAEAVYQDLTEGDDLLSVHMTDWPVADAALTDFDLERDMATVRAAVDAAAYARQKANMKLRWPVAKLVFASDDPDVRSALTRFRPLLLEQANAKDVELVSGEWERLDLAVVPNKAVIGKTYRADGPRVLAALAQMDQPRLRDLRRTLARGEKAALDVGGMTVDLSAEVVGFETRLPEHTSGADFPGGSVYVDTDVSPDLQAEGAARDLTRRIQEMRKALGLAMSATIRTQVQSPADFADAVRPQLAAIAEATRSTDVTFTQAPPRGDLVREWDLEGATVLIGVATGAAPTQPAPAERAPRLAKPKAKKAAPPKKKAKPAAKAKKAAPAKAKGAKAKAKKAAPKAKKKAPAKGKAAKKAGKKARRK